MIDTADWIIIAASLLISLGIGWWAARKTANNTESYFLAGRDMPWWLLGISMVATTFAADTPPFVTQIVRESGVASNWTARFGPTNARRSGRRIRSLVRRGRGLAARAARSCACGERLDRAVRDLRSLHTTDEG